MLMTQHRLLTGKLVIATHNPGKLIEMRELLAPHGVDAVSAQWVETKTLTFVEDVLKVN